MQRRDHQFCPVVGSGNSEEVMVLGAQVMSCVKSPLYS